MAFSSKYHYTNEQMSYEYMQIEAAKQDPAKFAPLYDKYYKQIFLFVNRRMADKEAAFDITAQVFLKALSKIHTYNFKGVPFGSWLYTIASNEINQLFREKKKKRYINADVGDLRNIYEEIEENVYDEVESKIIQFIKQLPEKELQLIEMRFFEKRQFKEIAEILNLKESNTKVKLSRLLVRIKKLLKDKSII